MRLVVRTCDATIKKVERQSIKHTYIGHCDGHKLSLEGSEHTTVAQDYVLWLRSLHLETREPFFHHAHYVVNRHVLVWVPPYSFTHYICCDRDVFQIVPIPVPNSWNVLRGAS